MKEIYEVSDDYLNSQLKYLKLLSKQYSTISKASAEIINLKAILNLPKGTEHFLSDIHGEYEPFVHVLKNASGVVKRKIETWKPEICLSLITVLMDVEDL